MRRLFITLAFFALLFPLNAQEPNNISANLYRQLQLFPQEKVYLMTDKAAYVAGEHLWFRAFLTDAFSHRLDIPQSRYVYVDLIAPDGEVVKQHKIRPDSNGVFHNRIELADDMVEGTYLLRAYTTYMRARTDYIFEKKVFIADPQSSVIAVEPQFTITRDRNVSVQFRFRDLRDSSFLRIETIKLKVGKGELEEFPGRRTVSFRTDPQKDKYLYLTFSHNNRRYQKFIPIPYPNETPFDVSFFPEGGYLIDNAPSKVGFKALRTNGLSEDISGTVFDSNDQPVASFQSLHAGMGSFTLFPEVGEWFYALCSNKDTTLKFELPIVQLNACALRVIERNDQFIITAQDQRNTLKDDLFLIAHLRGMVLYADKMPQNNMLVLQSADLPAGIIQLLLLDKELNPLSERLVFNKQRDFIQAAITPDQADYGRRELVKVNVTLEVPKGRDPFGHDYVANGSFALSVTDDCDILPDSTMTIASYLLLSSELRGYIEDTGFYLTDDPNAKEALDALMLTQGWRRYDIPKAAKGKIEEPTSYIEGGQEFSGTVKEYLLSKIVPNGLVWIMAPEMDYIEKALTDKSGKFYASGFEFPDSTQYMIFARAEKNRRVELTLNPQQSPLPTNAVMALSKSTNKSFSDYVAKANQKFIDEQGMRSYEVPEVVVTAKKNDEERSIYSSEIGGHVVPQMILERFHLDIVSMLKQAADVYKVTTDYPIKVFLRPLSIHVGAALIVLDDVPMSSETSLDVFVGIPIKRIEILKAPFSYILGLQGGGGAILITTGWEEEEARKPTPNMTKITPLGYKKAAEFYAPKYETEDQRNTPKPDLRTTIYWKPDVQVVDGKASVEFYTADAAKTTYSAVLEGITTDGVVVRKVGKVNI